MCPIFLATCVGRGGYASVCHKAPPTTQYAVQLYPYDPPGMRLMLRPSMRENTAYPLLWITAERLIHRGGGRACLVSQRQVEEAILLVEQGGDVRKDFGNRPQLVDAGFAQGLALDESGPDGERPVVKRGDTHRKGAVLRHLRLRLGDDSVADVPHRGIGDRALRARLPNRLDLLANTRDDGVRQAVRDTTDGSAKHAPVLLASLDDAIDQHDAGDMAVLVQRGLRLAEGVEGIVDLGLSPSGAETLHEVECEVSGQFTVGSEAKPSLNECQCCGGILLCDGGLELRNHSGEVVTGGVGVCFQSCTHGFLLFSE